MDNGFHGSHTREIQMEQSNSNKGARTKGPLYVSRTSVVTVRSENSCGLYAQIGDTSSSGTEQDRADFAARIVACVNDCDQHGMPSDLRAQRDELLAALRDVTRFHDRAILSEQRGALTVEMVWANARAAIAKCEVKS